MTEDDTPEALEARCWALRERVERAESERDKALAVCREHEMLASEIVSDALDPSVNVAWMRCSPDLPKYVRALEAAAGEMRAELDALMVKACDCIGADEDNKPECYCCGMCLDSVAKGHKSDCLAKAVMECQHALSHDCGKGWASPETVAKWEKEREHCRQQADNWEHRADKFQAQVKLLVEALQRIKNDRSSYWCHFAADTLAVVKGQP